jgi:hypothetical protein
MLSCLTVVVRCQLVMMSNFVSHLARSSLWWYKYTFGTPAIQLAILLDCALLLLTSMPSMLEEWPLRYLLRKRGFVQ